MWHNTRISAGPNLVHHFINSLLKRLRLPIQAFADDLKFIDDVDEHNVLFVQSEVNIIVDIGLYICVCIYI